MNISWQWLNELIDLDNITPKSLANKLTLAGFEVESITHNIQNDTILNISTTANRSDTLSIIGLAKEVAAILRKPYKKSKNRLQLKIAYKSIDKKKTQCNTHIYSSIHDIHIAPSPKWLQQRLKQYDIQPHNNIIDILNFISLKWGHHVEVYDLNQINPSNHGEIDLQVTAEQVSNSLIDRDNNSIILPDKSLTTIKHKNSTLALAGLTSSKQSQITPDTKNILIQTTICNTHYIQETSKILNISTKESILQTKGIRIADLFDGYKEAILLITSLAKGKIKQTVCAAQTQNLYKPIYIDQTNINDILGDKIVTIDNKDKDNLTIEKIFNLLNHLRLIVYKFSGYLQVNIPPTRTEDIYRTIDIVEEITRLHGFDQFLDRVPRAIHDTHGITTITQHTLSHIRYILRSFGMHETMHSSLIYNQNSRLRIYNPLTEEFNYLKNHLMCGLLETHKYNIHQGNEGIEIFETGKVFTCQKNKQTESINVAGIFGSQSSNRSTWSHVPIHLSWFQAKGQLEELFDRLNIQIRWKPLNNSWYLYNDLHKYFHPKYVAMLYNQQQAVGIFGEIKSKLNKENNKKIYGFEIRINDLICHKYKVNCFEEYSKYPSIIRDINFNIDNQIPYETILNKIQKYNDPLIESIKLFDVYIHQKNKKTISLRVTYRSPNSTLTNTEIEKIETRLKQNI